MSRVLRLSLIFACALAFFPHELLAQPLAVPAAQSPKKPRRAAHALTGVVNINSANETELSLLPGIGPAKAKRIIESRSKARFKSTDQLMRVKGIGKKSYRKLKPYLSVSGETTLRKERAAGGES